MNKLNFKNVLMLVAILSATLIACVPEDGDTGPVGPIGPEGPPGADGSIGRDGNDGADGVDGGSQVQSKTYTVNGTDFVSTGSFLRDTISEPLLTQDIVDNGAVQVYFSNSDNLAGATWNVLPHRLVLDVGMGPEFVNFSYSYAQNNFYLSVVAESGTQFNFTNAANFFYKLVIIPDVFMKEGVEYEDINYTTLETLHEIQDFGLVQ